MVSFDSAVVMLLHWCQQNKMVTAPLKQLTWKKGLLYLRLTKSPFSTCKKSRTFLYIPQIHTGTYWSVHRRMGNLCIWKTMTFTKRKCCRNVMGVYQYLQNTSTFEHGGGKCVSCWRSTKCLFQKGRTLLKVWHQLPSLRWSLHRGFILMFLFDADCSTTIRF